MRILIKDKRKGGFTLIELLVVISIFTIITTVALFDQGKLNSNVLLTNLAYDVALTVRQAQAYGVGVKYSSNGSESGGYGVHLDTANKDVITVFHDTDGNGIYSVADGDTEEKKYQFLNQRGNQLSELCIGDTTNALTIEPSCKYLTTDKSVDSVDISFKRPDPEASFNVGGNPVSGPAYLVLRSQDGTNCRAVVVEASGQIRVEGSESLACNVRKVN